MRTKPKTRLTARGRGLSWAIALTAAGAILGGGALAGAAIPSLEQRVDSAQAEAQLVTQRIEERGARLAELEQRAADAAAREQELGARLAESIARSQELASQLERTREELEVVRGRYRRAVAVLSRRLVDIYKSSEPDYLSVVLESADFEDLTTRAEYLEALRDADERIAGRVAQLRDELAAGYARTLELKASIDEQARDLAAARAEIAEIRSRAAARAAEIAAARAAEQAALAELQERISGWELEIRREAARRLAEAEEQGTAFLGGPYSIPTYIVICESGGNYQALNPSSGAGGAYQIIPSTWKAYGGSGLPHQASKAEQDRIAALIWQNDGPGAWSCA